MSKKWHHLISLAHQGVLSMFLVYVPEHLGLEVQDLTLHHPTPLHTQESLSLVCP